MMRVLVTGGAGFIGSHIVDALLEAGHEPAVLDNLSTGSKDNLPSGVPLIEADVRDDRAVQQAFADVKPHAVSHQAAQMSVSRSVANPKFDADVNIMGLLTVLQEAAAAGVSRFVFASSGGVLYGDVDAPAPEEAPKNPISPYGISKWVGERYLGFFAETAEMETVALRYSNVFGPRQNPHGEAGVVAIFSQRMLRGEATRINGDGKYIRDYVYGTDVAAANVAALTSSVTAPFVAFNIGTGIPTDVNELAAQLYSLCSERYSGSIPEPEHAPPRPGDLRSNLVSHEKAKRELRWTPKVGLEEGLRRSVEWFAERA